MSLEKLPTTSVKAYAVYNLAEMRLLAAENADLQLPVASLTKIMTAVVVLDNLQGEATSSQNSADNSSPQDSADGSSFQNFAGGSQNSADGSQDSTDSSQNSADNSNPQDSADNSISRLELSSVVNISEAMLSDLDGWAAVGLKVGDAVTVKDLLYALMLPSAGDAGQALAIAVAGNLENFATLMNQKAAELGMSGTHFSNPIGRDEENYSTAADMAILLNAALRNSTFREIFSANEYDSPAFSGKIYKTCDLLKYNLTGAKTGFTYAAGRSLASVATRKGVDYLVVALGADDQSENHILDSVALYDYFGDNYGYQVLLENSEEILTLPVENGENIQNYPLVATEWQYFLPNDTEEWDLTFLYSGVERVAKGMKNGDYLGTLKLEQAGTEIYHQDFYLEEEVKFQQNWLGLTGAILVMFAAMAGGIIAWRKKRKKLLALILAGVAVISGGFALVLVLLPGDAGWQEIELPREFATKEIVAEHSPESEENPPAESSVAENTEANYTLSYGPLMLINPNFTVSTDWIAQRSTELVDLSASYGVVEVNAWNGTPRIDAEAAPHFADMLAAYAAENPGHQLSTMSCFRAVGTNCGRLCYVTGTSDHHSGYTCDLIDTEYGTTLDTEQLESHPEWQWLHENSWKFGFIDRFLESWAGGSMSEPVNVDANGTTGLYETWHFRYVGLSAAQEIATGVYNNGNYDSLEHYLQASGRVQNLLQP